MSRIQRPLRLLGALLLLAGMTLAVAWFAGAFHPKVAPGRVAGQARPVPPPQAWLEVRAERVPVEESAPGTVQAVRETAVASRVLARVEAVHVRANQAVAAGHPLVDLDDREFQARVAQAEQSVQALAAAAEQAGRELERSKGLWEKKLLSENDWDRVQTEARGASAHLEQAREALSEARSQLAHTRITAPIAGTVVEKRVDVGDMAAPGQVLVTIYDPSRMQLWARVRESLALGLAPGRKVSVAVPVKEGRCEGLVDEVVPEADAASRTFLVKISGPCPPGILKGMYGTLFIPVGERAEIRIPASAVGRVGQLALVMARGPEGEPRRRFVRLGRAHPGGLVEVLAGLAPGEAILREFGATGV